MMNAKLLPDPPVRPIGSFTKLVGDKLPLLLLGQLSPSQIQRPGHRPLFILGQPLLDNLGTVVAQFDGDSLSVVAVDDFSPGAIRIDDDRDNDAVHGNVVPERQELVIGQRRKFQYRLVTGLLRRFLDGLRHGRCPRGITPAAGRGHLASEDDVSSSSPSLNMLLSWSQAALNLMEFQALYLSYSSWFAKAGADFNSSSSKTTTTHSHHRPARHSCVLSSSGAGSNITSSPQ